MARIVASTRPAPGRVTAVLGPTNTGKTHYAIERMLGHDSGVIGLPLRLLAREVYEKVVRAKGRANVALLTGEEKIMPGRPHYWVCTVESMPMDVDASFLAVDEIQLCTDPERGHIFTDRLLHARGAEETLMLGSQTMRGVIQTLLDNVTFVGRERFSKLSYAGSRKLSRLPRRSAVVAFSANEVYAIAELIRRQRGGAAVVLGALSPRTRNAQVELYESGEVDFMVATDAIGMGLNLAVDHVAFASLQKFDGRSMRHLRAPELAQIAGRAGRHTNDGTFGVTGDIGSVDPDVIAQIEGHSFDPVRSVQWRNANLAFDTLAALIESLEATPDGRILNRTRESVDLAALRQLAVDPEVTDTTTSPDAVRRLWDVAQVPDFRKTVSGEHVTLLKQIFLGLRSDKGTIDEDWMARQVARLDNTGGDIDHLANRIAHIRTWTYVSNRAGWLEHPSHWQERTRAIEDRLSDALHERLTQRFVDRRTSVLQRRLRQREDLMAQIGQDGRVEVEGEYVGRLDGFRFVADPDAAGTESKTLRAAAGSVMGNALEARVATLRASKPDVLTLSEQGAILWDGAAIGRLSAGPDPLSPRIELWHDEHMTTPVREKAVEHLQTWINAKVLELLGPLLELRNAENISGITRGLAYQLAEGLGAVIRSDVANELKEIDQNDRGLLRKLGVRFAEYSVYVPAVLKPGPARLKLILWSLYKGLPEVPEPLTPGLVGVPVDPSMPDGFYTVCGFRVCGPIAVRIDMVERLADALRPLAKRTEENKHGEFIANADLMSLVGRSGEDFAAILQSLGYRPRTEQPESGEPVVYWRRKGPGNRSQEQRRAGQRPPRRAGGENTQNGAAAKPVFTVGVAPLPAGLFGPPDPFSLHVKRASAPSQRQHRRGGRPAGPKRDANEAGRPRKPRRGRKSGPRPNVSATDATQEGAQTAPARQTANPSAGSKAAAKNRNQRVKPAAQDRRPARKPDPNSPFAALADLRVELEKASRKP